jgi:lysophospholipase L1-like esterase
MSVDPANLTPKTGAGLPTYGNAAPPLLRPAPFNCLAGTVPTIPSFTPSAYWTATRTIHDVTIAAAGPGSVVFLGDSITQELDVSQISPFGVNFGINGDTLEGLLTRLSAHSAVLSQARAVCLMIGVNDVTAGVSNANIQDYFMRVFNWLTGPLVWTKTIRTINSTWNTAIDTNNTYVAGQLSGRSNYAMVDINSQITDGSGLLLAQYAVDDRHLNAAGQAIWRAAVRAALANV